MLNVAGKRASGKTTKLIEYANMLYLSGFNPVLIVMREDSKEFYLNKGLNKNIPMYTFDQYRKDRIGIGTDNVTVLIDEVDYILEQVLHTKHLVVTSDVGTIWEIKRSDWDKNYKED